MLLENPDGRSPSAMLLENPDGRSPSANSFSKLCAPWP
jgi:hypothetical protein